MNSLYALFILLHILPIAILIGLFVLRTKVSSRWKAVLGFFAVTYGFIIYSARIEDWYLHYQLYQFDLDGDGMFGGIESTPEQAEAARKLAADTGRTFAVFTGLIFSIPLAFALYIMLKVFSFAKRRSGF